MSLKNITRYTCDVQGCDHQLEIPYVNQPPGYINGPEGWAHLKYTVFGGETEEMIVCDFHRNELNVVLFRSGNL